MPSNITESDTYTATVQTISDGDSQNAANQALAPQALANRTHYLKNRVGGYFEVTSGRAASSSNVLQTTTSGPVDVAGSTINLAVVAGDIVEVTCTVNYDNGGGLGSGGVVALKMVDGATTDSELTGIDGGATAYGGRALDLPSATTTQQASLTKVRTATSTGTLSVCIRAGCISNTHNVNVGPFSIKARVLRAV